MSYIGNNLQVAYPSYRNIDDISGSFDGVTTSFPLTVGGSAPVPAPLSSNQCLISVGGVVQRPDDSGTEGFLLSGGNIVFSAAPTGGDDFFGVILAGADYVNVGVNFPSGTAAAPSITFDTDLDTGLFNPGANEIGITTGGSSRLRITSAGLVGIGSSTPGAILDVAPDANRNLQVQGKSGTTYGLEIKNGTANSAGEFHVTAASSGSVVINRGTTEIARFTPTGLGIGSTSPNQALQVEGSIRVAHNNKLEFGGSNYYILGNATTGYLQFAAAGNEAARIDSSGRLLVGTSTASSADASKTEIYGGGTGDTDGGGNQLLLRKNQFSAGNQTAHMLRLRSGTGTQGQLALGLLTDSGGNIYGFIDQVNGLGTVFRNAGTERMRITNAGRVGINDDTAGYAELLQVDGTGNTSNQYALALKVGTTGSAFHVRFGDTTGVIGSITSNAGTVAYNPFLGCHWARLENGEKIEVPVGTIIETVDKEIEWNFAVFDCQGETKKMAWNGSEKPGETVEVSYEGNTYTATIEPESVDPNVLNKHVCVKVNDTPNSPAVFGVFFGQDSDEGSTNFIGSWNDCYVAAVGNYFIRIAAQETVQIGDLISSDGTGCGVVQATDAITSKTVAKVTSTKKHSVYEDGSYLVTCVLYCG